MAETESQQAQARVVTYEGSAKLSSSRASIAAAAAAAPRGRADPSASYPPAARAQPPFRFAEFQPGLCVSRGRRPRGLAAPAAVTMVTAPSSAASRLPTANRRRASPEARGGANWGEEVRETEGESREEREVGPQ